MSINQHVDSTDNSSCTLVYDEQECWLYATWRGYIDPLEVRAGAELYLDRFFLAPTPLLLKDNSRLRGPWFDSLDWLGDVWVPQAMRLGLRYVAHIVQANRHSDVISSLLPTTLPFELQVFQDLADVQQWVANVATIRNPLVSHANSPLPVSKRKSPLVRRRFFS
jgi:hypothetical protein